MKHRQIRAEFDLAFLGLAILRTWPPAERERLVKEFLANAQDPALHEAVDLEEHDLDSGYELWAETYDTMDNPLIDLEEPILRGWLGGIPAGAALDAACGTGRHAAFLVEMGHRVTGIDGSAAMLERAIARVPEADFRQGRLESLPFDTDAFDVAVCSLALSHCADLTAPMAELARVVRPGGQVLLSDIHPFSAALGGGAYFRDQEGNRRLVANLVHWPSVYLDAFRGAGLTVQDCQEPLLTPERAARMAPLVNGDWFVRGVSGLPFALLWQLAVN